MTKTILALDVATTTGWAVGRIGGVPSAGAYRFRGRGATEHDDIWAEALKWLNDMISMHAPDIVALEAPILSPSMGGGSNPKTLMLLTGLQAVMRTTVCLRMPSLARLIHVQSARKVFIGKGNLRGDVAKKMARDRCIELGWLTIEDATYDKADALCVWAKAAADLDNDTRHFFERLKAPKKPVIHETELLEQ